MSRKFLLSCLTVTLLFSSLTATAEELLHFEFKPFGPITVFKPASEPKTVVIFASGDEGWSSQVALIADAIAGSNGKAKSDQNVLVVGFDTRKYLSATKKRKSCLYAAVDFENLSHWLQKKLKLKHYIIPVLAGHSAGATLVFATLLQAPQNTFSGAVSMGFCPELAGARSFCEMHGLKEKQTKAGIQFTPAKRLLAPWTVLQGQQDEACPAGPAREFTTAIEGAKYVELPKVGHGFSKSSSWLRQFKEALEEIQKQHEVSYKPSLVIQDLPLIEVPSVKLGNDPRMVVFYSGDGGWASIDREVSENLATKGIPTIGVNSLDYFWQKKDPDGAALDLQRVIDVYTQKWGRKKVILAGFSLGADVLPSIAARLSKKTISNLAGLALIGPSQTVNFEFNVMDWVVDDSTGQPVLPEVEKLRKKVPLICIYGDSEKDSLCPTIKPDGVKVLKMSGGHHFGGDFDRISDFILNSSSK
jgi:type IV secretory pathway VirJ component